MIPGNATTESANAQATARLRILGCETQSINSDGQIVLAEKRLSKGHEKPIRARVGSNQPHVHSAAVVTVGTDAKGYLTRPSGWRSVSTRMLDSPNHAFGRTPQNQTLQTHVSVGGNYN